MSSGFKWAAASCLLFAVDASSAQLFESQQPTIRLPAVVHVWRDPNDASTPEITIEELSRCVGDDVGIRGRVSGLESQQTKLEAELVDLNAKSAALEKVSASLVVLRTGFEKSVKTFEEGGAGLDQLDAQIGQLKGKQNLTPAEIKQANGLIARYNVEVAKRNEQRDRLLAFEKDLQGKLDAYNDSVRGLNEHADNFNVRNSAFSAEADAFNRELASYRARCAGQRTLKTNSPDEHG